MRTSSEKDICVYKKHIPYNIRKRKSKYGYSIDIEKIGTILKEYGLYMKKSEDKFIPKEYLFNSRENRLNILKGLMDSDGTVSKSVPSICTSSKQLNDDILFLVRSLGINAKSTLRKTFFNGRQYKDSFEITIYTDEIIFNLPRKINKLSKKDTLLKRSKIDYTTLINIEYSHDEEAKCITILDPESIYLIEDFIPTHNSKSYSISALLSRLFVVGDSPKGSAKTRGVIMAHDKEKLIKDGTLNKFLEAIDFQAKNTEFPSARIKSTLDGMQWKMGYKDKISGIERGTLNEIMGSAINDDVDKIRGKRAQLLVYEEFGAFPKFLDVWNTNRRSVQSGNIAFGQAIAIGTGGSEGANFYGALQMIYSPKAYNVYALPNYYDRSSNGNGTCVFFFGAYINRPGYMNRDGVSDVTGALIEIFRDRYNVKYNATDTLTLTRVIAEDPITIQEAIMRREGSIFPSAALNDRLNEIKTNPHILDDVYVGMLKQNSNGEIEFDPTIDAKWIKHYPHQDNKIHGAVAIFKMPEKDNTGKVFGNRYILASVLCLFTRIQTQQ